MYVPKILASSSRGLAKCRSKEGCRRFNLGRQESCQGTNHNPGHKSQTKHSTSLAEIQLTKLMYGSVKRSTLRSSHCEKYSRFNVGSEETTAITMSLYQIRVHPSWTDHWTKFNMDQETIAIPVPHGSVQKNFIQTSRNLTLENKDYLS